MRSKGDRPEDLRVSALEDAHDDPVILECIEDDEDNLVGSPYVDGRIDLVIPSVDGDLSEQPEAIRKVASWLMNAADWLERRQR